MGESLGVSDFSSYLCPHEPTTNCPMNTKNHRWGLMALLLGLVVYTACQDSDDDDDAYVWSASGATTTEMEEDFSMTDMDNFIEMNLKMENMRIQYYKLISDGWEGDILGGMGENSNPMELYTLLEEILDKKDVYAQAIRNLDDEGVFDDVTTRGTFAEAWDMIVNGWGATAENRKNQILDVMEKKKLMGNARALQDLFNILPDKWRKGETDYKQWFINLNQGKYNNLCPNLHVYWVVQGAGSETEDGVAIYSSTALNMDNGNGNVIWGDAHKVGVEQAQKAGNFTVAVWNEATGGYVGKWSDAETIYKETTKLRKKIKNGSYKPSDIRKWAISLASIYANNKLSELLTGEEAAKDPDWLRITRDMAPGGTDIIAGELVDWLTEHADEFNESTATENEVTIAELISTFKNNMNYNTPVVFVSKDSNGKITLVPADKVGEARLVTKPGKKTVTTVTKDGKRVTQKVTMKPGKQKVETFPVIDNPTLSVIPSADVLLTAQAQTKVVEYYTNMPYVSAKSLTPWIKKAEVKNGVFTIEVEENTDLDKRVGKALLVASIDGQKVEQEITVIVTQQTKAVGDVKADPPSLEFDASGGTKTTTVYCSGHPYYIVDKDEKIASWVTITASEGDDAVILTVKADPNPTSDPRSGYITVKCVDYELESEFDSYKPGEVYPAKIFVSQSANKTETIGAIEKIYIEPNCYMGQDWSIYGDWLYDANFGTEYCVIMIDHVNTTQTGSTLSVTGTRSEEYDTDYFENVPGSKVTISNTASFIIENVGNGFKDAVLKNLTAHLRYESYSYNDKSTDVTEMNCTSSNVPFAEYRDWGGNELTFAGSIGAGVTNYSFTATYGNAIYHPDNHIKVKIYFK